LKCPDCKSDKIRRSRRVGPERLLGSILFWFPFRCKDCGKRFWLFDSPLKSRMSIVIVGVSLLLIILMLIIPKNNKRSLQKVRDSNDGVSKTITVDKNDVASSDKERIPLDGKELKKVNDNVLKADSSSKVAIEQKKQSEGPAKANEPVATKPVKSTNADKTDSTEKEITENVFEGPEQSFYCLHVGSYKSLSNAKAEVELFAGKGLYAWSEKVDISGKGEWIRVFIGRYTDRAEALRYGTRLKAEKVISDFIIRKK